MSLIKRYKKDVNSVTSTNVSFNDIKHKVNMNNETKTEKRKILFPSLMITGGVLTSVAAAVVIAFALRGNPGAGILQPNDAKFSLKAIAKSATPLMTSQLSTNTTDNSLRKMANFSLLTQDATNEEIIQDLLYQFDTIIQNDDNYKVEAVESDREDYKYKEIITYKDLLNNSNSYALYYNSIDVEKETDDDEVETETKYGGIAVKDGQEFNFKLELEEEVEGDEKEVESTFYLFEKGSNNSYTKVSSSSEIEGLEKETEYSFEVVKNGSTITSYEMEIEHDPSDNEVELSVELNEKEYSIERIIEEGETYFFVEFEDDETDEEQEWVFKKVIEGDKVSYVEIE